MRRARIAPNKTATAGINGPVTRVSSIVYALISLCLASVACTGSSRPAPFLAEAPTALSVMTFNIRYAHTQPPDLWPARLPVIAEMIERRRPDIIGTQEGLYHQLRDLENALPDYGWIGIGRDGGSRGEFMAVFYRKDRLEPLEYDHYWLSDTPAIAGSRTWGNNYPRMVTSVRLRDRVASGELIFVNTHLDHEVQASRARSAALILDRHRSAEARVPVILVGDFNVDARDNPVYSMLTAPGAFTDTWVAAGNQDTLGTFHGFKGVTAARGEGRIDWILVRGEVDILSSEIVTDSRGTQMPSDHFPVVAQLRVRTAGRASQETR
jgi:endonuclease/exonuclease/phosphatase family metal-dependent hydrolase